MKYLASWTSRAIAILALVALLFGGLYLKSCSEARQRAAQSRVDQGQAGAFRTSVEDTLNTIGAAGERERSSEEMSRENEKEIRNADGANDVVNPAARDAGLRSLCRRAAYRDSERCRVYLAHPR